MSLILGIDQSFTKTGVVLLDNVNDIIVAAMCISSCKDDDIFKRAYDITNRLSQVALQYKPDYIMIEGLAFGATGNAARDLSGLQFVIATKLKYELAFDVNVVSPRTVKKLACGNGTAEKNSVLEGLPPNVLAYFKSLGFKKTTGLTDLADAYWIAKSYALVI